MKKARKNYTADEKVNDKHGCDTKFEDLFRDRTDEEFNAIKKQYGASGDILEAEKHIEASPATSSITTPATSSPMASKPESYVTRN